jgi:hypothetical protein
VITLGWQVVEWIEATLRHGPGDVQGEKIQLDDEFAEAICRMYELDTDGRRKVRRYVLSRAKGRSKSELAGMLVCAEAFGPVRFDGWDADGEPVGRPPAYPFIRCLATEELQSGNTYDNVVAMLTDAIDRGDLSHQIDVGLTRVFIPGSGEIRPSTASSASKDGGKETFAVFDETHLYTLPDLKSMHRMVRRNLRKRRAADPWSLETTTMYEQGAESIAELTHRALLDGRLGDDVVFDHREGPDPETFDFDDDRQLHAALAETYGPFAEVMDLDGIIREIRDPTNEKADSIRYFLNRASSAASDFLALADWDRLADPNLSLEPGETICVGFDGSKDDDSTGIVGVTESGGTFVLGVWEPATTGGKLPRNEIRARVAEIFDRYRVVRWYGDPRYWETDHDEWEAAYGSPPVTEIPQSITRIHQAAQRVVTLVRAALGGVDEVEAPGITHTGDPILRRHIGNARRERWGGRAGDKDGKWKLAKKHADHKIDLATAATFAHQARGDAIAAGEFVQPMVNVWSV